jgi:glycosidase
LNKRLKFFEKDTIDWSDPKQLQPFYKKLVTLHADNPALWGGEYGGMPVRINNENPNVYAFKRTKDNNKVIGVLNFSNQPHEFILIDTESAGNYQDYFTGESYELDTTTSLKLSPWQYLLFVKNEGN